MVAAAGCGKTHLIAYAVANHASGRELILTHTHAGVDAIRVRLAKLGAEPKRYAVDTIAGWSLRLATAFPATSALPTSMPRNNAEYAAVYSAAAKLLGLEPIREIIRASYSGAYVDEYQDCTLDQHALVLALGDVLPCRILGDELQSIFRFGGHDSIVWSEHVSPTFHEVPGPTNPWRWADKNPGLGTWLQGVRKALLSGQAVEIEKDAPVRWVDGSDPSQKQVNQRNACFNVATHNGKDSVVAIHHLPNQCHHVASRLKGMYSCVEAIDTKDLFDSAETIGGSTGFGRASAVIDFAAMCMTQVKSELATIRTAFADGRVPKVKKHTVQLAALIAVVENNSLAAVEVALQAIRGLPSLIVYRRELFHEMERALRTVLAGEAETLAEAAWVVRNRTRRKGRLLSRCCVGSTLLVKGLEFDHAIVLDADGYDAANLYVALTRGSKSLTVVSKSRVIQPSMVQPKANVADGSGVATTLER